MHSIFNAKAHVGLHACPKSFVQVSNHMEGIVKTELDAAKKSWEEGLKNVPEPVNRTAPM